MDDGSLARTISILIPEMLEAVPRRIKKQNANLSMTHTDMHTCMDTCMHTHIPQLKNRQTPTGSAQEWSCLHTGMGREGA